MRRGREKLRSNLFVTESIPHRQISNFEPKQNKGFER